MLDHSPKICFQVGTLDYLCRTIVVLWDFADKPCNVKTQLLALIELRVKKDIIKLDYGWLGKLAVTLLNVRQIPEGAGNLYKDHSFPRIGTFELKNFRDGQRKERDHFIVNWTNLDLLIWLSEALDCTNRVVEQIQNLLVISHGLASYFLAQQVTKQRITVLNEALWYHIAELGDQALLHEHFIELPFLGIN